MKDTRELLSKKGWIVTLMLLTAVSMNAKSDLFTVVEGSLDVLLEQKKTAVFEIDYSKMIVIDEKDPDNSMPFREWMIAQDEDNDEWSKQVQDEDDDKWTTDWETKDKEKCHKAFREHYNDEVKQGLKLSKLGKDYKVVLRLKMIDFGPAVKYGFGGIKGGEAKADGVFEVRDLNTDEVKLILKFEGLKGDSSFKQIGRLIGIFENFGEKLSDYLKDYQKEQKKKKK